MYYFDI